MALHNGVSKLRASLPTTQLSRIAASTPLGTAGLSRRNYAAVNPPVTQNAVGSKGPTAIVFMNMGGPSTTDEVGDFLSRLFVSLKYHASIDSDLTPPRQMETSSL
jgi:protoporphyrin/coproporphyrin ferrochelatase